MKKKRRNVTVAVTVLLLGSIALLVALGFFADRAIKATIETAGTEALGVQLAIADVDVSLLGTLTLQDVVIDNPPGYEHEELLSLKKGRAQIRIGSLTSDVVSIKEVKLEGVDLVMEQQGLNSNLQDMIDMIDLARASVLTRRNLEIDLLEITDIKVRVKILPIPGSLDTVTLKLAPIRMHDLGKGEKLHVGTLSAKVILAILKNVLDQGVDVLPEDLSRALSKTLGTTVDLGRRIVGQAPQARRILQGAADLGRGLKGVLQGGRTKRGDPNTGEAASVQEVDGIEATDQEDNKGQR